MTVAKKFAAPGRRKMHFAVSDVDELNAELKDLGISYTNDTPVVVARDLPERRYIMHQPLTYVVIALSRVFTSAVFGLFKVNLHMYLFSFFFL